MGELLKKQLVRTRIIAAKEVEGLSAEALSFIPDGFRNNLHWQIGHILVTAEMFFLPTKELPESYRQFFGNGTAPSAWTEDVPSVDVLLAQLAEQAEKIQHIDVATFDTPLEKPMLGNNTVGEFFSMGAFHESLHVGQIQSIKKVVEASLLKSL